MKAFLFQGFLDFLDMCRIAGLHGESEYAGIHLVAIGRTVVMNSRDVAAQACDDVTFADWVFPVRIIFFFFSSRRRHTR